MLCTPNILFLAIFEQYFAGLIMRKKEILHSPVLIDSDEVLSSRLFTCA